jgi:beta propeller repeat protein
MKRAELYCVILGILTNVSTALAVQVYSFPICTDPAGQEWARVGGNTVVWIESRNGNRDVYGYNLQTKTEFPICTNPSKQAYPAGLDISGPTVVYQSEITPYYPDIYAYSLPDGPESLAAAHQGWDPALKPRVDGDLLAWLSWKTIYARRLGGPVFPVNTGSADNPDVSGNIIVWQEWHDNNHYDIRGYNFDTQTPFNVSDFYTGNPNTSYKTNPAVSGKIVVWQDYRFNGITDIYGKNLATGEEFPICNRLGFQLNPDISGNIVVWVDKNGDINGNGPGIYGKNLLTGEEFFIASTTAAGTVAIDGNIVVWDSWLDIYGAYITDPDLNHDGRIALDDLGIMSTHWNQIGCAAPNYCGGADLNLSGAVEVEDLSILAHFWLFGAAEGGE